MNAIDTLSTPPENADYHKVSEAIRYLSETKPDQLDLARFARAIGLNERQLTALFKRWCGLTPKGFAQAVALDHAKSLLKQDLPLLDISHELGLSSPARLYDLFVAHEAMPPGIWRDKGAGLKMRWGITETAFGTTLLFMTDYGLAGLGFADGDLDTAYADLAGRWPKAAFVRDDAMAARTGPRIFEPGRWQAEEPLRIVLIGTDFEVRVWEGLLNIPLGRATTYGALAEALDKPRAARAVGAAVGRNPLSFVVPCHRVVGATGGLTGYHWGLTRKRAMLGWETGLTQGAD